MQAAEALWLDFKPKGRVTPPIKGPQTPIQHLKGPGMTMSSNLSFVEAQITGKVIISLSFSLSRP